MDYPFLQNLQYISSYNNIPILPLHVIFAIVHKYILYIDEKEATLSIHNIFCKKKVRITYDKQKK